MEKRSRNTLIIIIIIIIMCVCVCVCVRSLVLMVWLIFLYVDTVFGFYGYSFFMLIWMFQHDYFDTCCF